jgi:hypothetical protein
MDSYKTYYTTLENVIHTLETYGVAVIPGVMSKEECEANRELAWKEFSVLTSGMEKPLVKDNFDTYRSFYDLFPLHSMLVQHWGVGHMQWVWNVRQHPNVVNAFAKIWNVKPTDLLVSFDGVSLHLPPEITKKGWYRGNDWLHTDQSWKKEGRHCIQGFVNMYPTRKGDASLCVFEKSHKQHTTFFKKFKKEPKGDWYKLENSEERAFFEQEMTRVECNEGDLVLWDSRTFHQGCEPLKERKEMNTRMVAYVCMIPKNKCTAAKRKRRVEIFEEGRMTTHWPNFPKMFPTTPRTYGKEVPVLQKVGKPKLTELGKSLI